MEWKSALFNEVRGQIGHQFIASSTFGHNYLKSYKGPKQTDFKYRKFYRLIHTYAIRAWQAFQKLDEQAKQAWNSIARPYGYSGFDLYMSETKANLGVLRQVPIPPYGGIYLELHLNVRIPKLALLIQYQDLSYEIIADGADLLENNEGNLRIDFTVSTPKYKLWLIDTEVEDIYGGDGEYISRSSHWGFITWPDPYPEDWTVYPWEYGY
jgi:hypothetical protein